jgi:putative transposase
LSLEPLRQALREHFGGFGKDVASGLTARHDHSSQFISQDFQGDLKFPGIKSSPAYVRQPQGNGCAERFVRILKENLLWARSFATVEEFRKELAAFKKIYNANWIVGRHGYQTPEPGST